MRFSFAGLAFRFESQSINSGLFLTQLGPNYAQNREKQGK
jgi:hypothetical protein